MAKVARLRRVSIDDRLPGRGCGSRGHDHDLPTLEIDEVGHAVSRCFRPTSPPNVRMPLVDLEASPFTVTPCCPYAPTGVVRVGVSILAVATPSFVFPKVKVSIRTTTPVAVARLKTSPSTSSRPSGNDRYIVASSP